MLQLIKTIKSMMTVSDLEAYRIACFIKSNLNDDATREEIFEAIFSEYLAPEFEAFLDSEVA